MKFFVFAFVLILWVSANSQTNYFNNSYHLGEPIANETAMSFIETNTGYLIGAYSYTYTQVFPYNTSKIQLYEVDKQGIILWSKEFAGDSTLISPSSSRIFRVNDSTYEWFITSCDSVNLINRPVLIRFDNHGNILFSKVLYNPYISSSISYFPRQAISTSDGGYLLVCGSNGSVGTKLFKLNAMLEMEWDKDADSVPGYTVINNLYQLEDSSYMLGCYYFDGVNTRNGQVIHLFKNGETDRITQIGGTQDAECCFVIAIDDSNTMAINVFSTKPYYGKYQVNKIDSHGQLIWSKIIGDEKFDLRVTGLMRLPDSTFMISGYYGGPDRCLLFRINQYGDSLLYRELKYPDPSVDMKWIWDGQLTSDNGILFCGEITIPDPQYYYPQWSWLIKTDWYGCETVGCDSTDLYIFSSTPSRSICRGENNWFSVEGYGSGIKYQWQEKVDSEWKNLQNGFEYLGTVSDTLLVNNTDSFTNDKTYRCKVSNDFWQLYTPDIFLYYFEPPDISLQPVSVSVAPSDSVVFGIAASGIEEPSYQWYFMGNELDGAISDKMIIKQAVFSDTGFYQCKVWNSCGEKWSDTVWLKFQNIGIPETIYNQGIAVYPNPVSDYLSCIFQEKKSILLKYEIYNSCGDLILQKEENVENGVAGMNMKLLPSGVLILKIITWSGIYSFKIIKM
jgi:hypothetical protein